MNVWVGGRVSKGEREQMGRGRGGSSRGNWATVWREYKFRGKSRLTASGDAFGASGRRSGRSGRRRTGLNVV